MYGVWPVGLSTYIWQEFTFFFLREVFCGLNMQKMHLWPHWGNSRGSPGPLVGWGGDTPLQTPPHLAPRLSRLRCSCLPLPLHIISGYATDWHYKKLVRIPCCRCPQSASVPQSSIVSCCFIPYTLTKCFCSVVYICICTEMWGLWQMCGEGGILHS